MRPKSPLPFEKFAKDKQFYDFAISRMGSNYAAAHSSMHAAAFTEEFLQRLPMVLKGPFWAKGCVDVASSFQANILLPLRNSARYSSGSIESSVMAVMTGVVKSAEVVIQPVLRPPLDTSSGNQSLNFAMMLLLIQEKRPAAKPFAKHPAAAAPQAAAASASSANMSTDAKGKGYGRNSRGAAAGNDFLILLPLLLVPLLCHNFEIQ